MTDENLVSSLDATVPNESAVTNEHSVTSESQSDVDYSGYIPKDRVNKLVVDAKAKAYEKGLAEAKANVAASRETSKNSSFDESRIDELLGKKLESMRVQEEKKAQNAKDMARADVICGKLNASAVEFKKHTPEYEEAVASVNNFEGAEAILEAASELDNPAEVLFYLAQNPEKMPNLNAVCYNYNKTGAGLTALKKIAARLKENSDAVNSKSSAKPIGHIKTNVRSGIGEHGSALDDIQDMKKMDIFRV